MAIFPTNATREAGTGATCKQTAFPAIASYGSVAVYALLAIGAILFAIGLYRSTAVWVWRALAIGLGIFASLLAPPGPVD